MQCSYTCSSFLTHGMLIQRNTYLDLEAAERRNQGNKTESFTVTIWGRERKISIDLLTYLTPDAPCSPAALEIIFPGAERTAKTERKMGDGGVLCTECQDTAQCLPTLTSLGLFRLTQVWLFLVKAKQNNNSSYNIYRIYFPYHSKQHNRNHFT